MNIPKEPAAVIVPIETAIIIRKVFLPVNPNKMRGAHPSVVKAAKDFIAALEKASLGL